MVDSWTNKKQRILINFLVNSLMGVIFIESVDASKYAMIGEKMRNVLDGIMMHIGKWLPLENSPRN